MRKPLPAVCSLLLLSVLGVGCESAGPDDPSEAEALAGTQWHLLSAETAEGPTVQAEDLPRPYTAHFTGEQAEDGLGVGGQNVCNTYGGSYRAEGNGSITISSVVTTEAYCGEAATRVDATLFEKVQGGASYEISGERLTLSYAGDSYAGGGEKKQIVFERTSEGQ